MGISSLFFSQTPFIALVLGLGLEHHGATVDLPPGSVDGLAAAINAAGSGGTVRVGAGVHSESGTVLITSPVSVVGEPGAVIEFATAMDPASITVRAGLHIRNTSRVTIRGLELRPPPGSTANTGIVIESSPWVTIADNLIIGHEYGILVEGGDQAVISGNTVHAATGWQTGDFAEADCIDVINGRGVRIFNNTATDGLFGVFASGTKGEAFGNSCSNCFSGMILCHIPQGGFIISGVPRGSAISCKEWHVHNNSNNANFTTGILVIDGANKNFLVNNGGSGNGTYDIELVGDSNRFGFFTPTSSNNLVAAGRYHNLLVKDCGQNNTLLGFSNVVDNTVDPCN